MTSFSFYSFRIFKISPYINFKKFFGRILAPPSGRRPGADAPPCPPRYATVQWWQKESGPYAILSKKEQTRVNGQTNHEKQLICT